MTNRSVVVSIHDVSPLTREPVDAILRDLAAIGVPRVSLLVVPDHHHRASIADDPAFSTWLRRMIAAGHEPVLHGYYHQRERRTRESASTRFFTRLYTADEGEFFDIGHAASTATLTRGRDTLAQCAGIVPSGFIAPAWLLSAEAESAARELGFAYTTRLKSVVFLQASRVVESQSLCWSVRSAWRRAASLVWNPLLILRRLQANPLLRISIHPPDITHATIWRQIRCLTTRAIKDRTPLTYLDFVTGWKS